ncbi:MAG TPA: histidine kinase dimerization/phospho-acceptor domain-containing protein, partial [Geobacteraceae bacterium]|nr:histidine kinase dimerization/phospho-acceptor domain-containing protein [Geobacteraceae bacterium]
MRISFRFKLMLSYLLILLVMAGSAYLYLNSTMQSSVVSSLTEHLLSQTRLAALMLSRDLNTLQHDAPPLAAKLGDTLTARVTIISADGRVVGDSEVKPEELGEVENHLGRPEVQEALKSGTGKAVRYSATVKHEMLYTAATFGTDGHVDGIVRLALPLSSIQVLRSGLHKTLGTALLVSFLLTLIFSYILSRLTSRPLQQVAAIAAEMGRGNFTRRLPAEWHDELGDLAGIMNEMAARLDDQLSSLTAERNRLDAILSGMGEGLMVTDREGRITLVNPAFCSLFKVYDGLIGSPLSHISRHPALLESYSQVSHDKLELQNEMIVRTPEERFLSAHWVPLLNESGMQGVVAVFHDVTDLKRLENIRRDFVANVSHELRTPVTVIKGYSETLLDDLIVENPEKAAEFVEIILSHSERLAALLNDLLSLSEMESPDFSFRMTPIPVEGTVRKVCALLQGKADAKKITITTSGLSELSPVMADQGRLEQVLVNLLDNAVKYSSEGG